MKNDVVIVESVRTWSEIVVDLFEQKASLWGRASTYELPEEDKQSIRTLKEDLHNKDVVL